MPNSDSPIGLCCLAAVGVEMRRRIVFAAFARLGGKGRLWWVWHGWASGGTGDRFWRVSACSERRSAKGRVCGGLRGFGAEGVGAPSGPAGTVGACHWHGLGIWLRSPMAVEVAPKSFRLARLRAAAWIRARDRAPADWHGQSVPWHGSVGLGRRAEEW